MRSQHAGPTRRLPRRCPDGARARARARARVRACESGRPTRVVQVHFGDRTDCVEGARAVPFRIRVATLRSMCLHVSVVCVRAMSLATLRSMCLHVSVVCVRAMSLATLRSMCLHVSVVCVRAVSHTEACA